MTTQARQHYQNALDALTQSMRTRDVDAFLCHIHLPHVMATVDGTMTYSTAQAVSASFERYLEFLDTRGIDTIERTCIAARIDGQGTLEGYHVTRLSSGTQLAVNPFTTRMTFRLDDQNKWQSTRAKTGIAAAQWPILPDGVEITPPAKLACDDLAAFGIFQDILNAVTQQYLSGDLEGLHQLVDYPLLMQSRQGKRMITTLDELSEDFSLYQNEFRIHGVTDIIRTVKSADFVGPNQISGSYSTIIFGNGGIIVDPYESTMTLNLHQDGKWRMAAVLHSLGHLNWRREAQNS